MVQILARPASTIVVIRDQNAVLEILMLRRSSAVAAASGAHVFPGGGVDAVDVDIAERGLVTGLDDGTAARRLNLDSGAMPYYCAALRELFEEAGLLLAIESDGRPLSVENRRLVAWRSDLATGRVTWSELLEREGLRLAVGEMQYLAHWVTPERRLRRFDTRFFVAAAPANQEALPDDSEIVEHVWTTVSAALERQDTGDWSMLVPTVRTLQLLAPQHSVHQVLERAATSTVARIQPREVERDGRIVVVVPGEPGYGD
jgi:8-oxo-dGTP pyrophosphatase MutT (NUDIX family)